MFYWKRAVVDYLKKIEDILCLGKRQHERQFDVTVDVTWTTSGKMTTVIPLTLVVIFDELVLLSGPCFPWAIQIKSMYGASGRSHSKDEEDTTITDLK